MARRKRTRKVVLKLTKHQIELAELLEILTTNNNNIINNKN